MIQNFSHLTLVPTGLVAGGGGGGGVALEEPLPLLSRCGRQPYLTFPAGATERGTSDWKPFRPPMTDNKA